MLHVHIYDFHIYLGCTANIKFNRKLFQFELKVIAYIIAYIWH